MQVLVLCFVLLIRLRRSCRNQRTDLDRLIIELETNGTIDPEEAIRKAATILQQQISIFVDLEAEEAPEPVKEKKRLIRCYYALWTILN